MKKNLILLFCVLGSNFLWSQISISGSSNVEVSTNYSFSFSCIPKNPPTGATSYRLTSWQINSSLSNMNNASVPYKNDNSEALVNKAIGTSSSISFPIKWEDISNTTQDIINVTTYYTFYDSSGSVIGSSGSDNYKDSNGSLGYKVNIYRIFTPTISSGSILSCCSNNVLISASGYGNANLFDWTSLSGCTLVSGQGTPVITVTPDPFQSAVSATCFVGRTTAPISYIRSGSITTVKTTRTATFYPIYTVHLLHYICAKEVGNL